MNRKSLSALALGLAVAISAVAQARPQRGMSRYDPKTETTITGTVQEIQQITGHHGWSGTHIMVKTGDQVVDVHVGPAWFLEQKNFALAKSDRVTVLGSNVTTASHHSIIAREIEKEGKKLILRNADGIPQWSRRRTG